MLLPIGIVIGVVMGLTGAGGALVAIPLFMHFLGMDLKEASVYSLIAVVLASLSNFYFQRKSANFKLAFLFILASTIGSLFSQPYKALLPDTGIALLLALIAVYSLYNVWVPSKHESSSKEEKLNLSKTVIIGLILGVLTTFTGLGGGVLMLPVLLSMYKLPQKVAVATSLLVVGFSSLSSFVIQASRGMNLKLDVSFTALILGILITSYGLKWITSRIDSKKTDMIRKLVFTVVVVFSLAKIF